MRYQYHHNKKSSKKSSYKNKDIIICNFKGEALRWKHHQTFQDFRSIFTTIFLLLYLSLYSQHNRHSYLLQQEGLYQKLHVKVYKTLAKEYSVSDKSLERLQHSR